MYIQLTKQHRHVDVITDEEELILVGGTNIGGWVGRNEVGD